MKPPHLILAWALLAFGALRADGQTAAVSPTTADGSVALQAWKSAPPFSFNYGGKPSTEFLSSWTRTGDAVSGEGDSVSRCSYIDPVTRLRVTAEIQTYAGYDAVEWVLRFRNEGTTDTPIIDNILPLDLSVTGSGDVTLHHAHGSTAKASDFQPLNEPIAAGGVLNLHSENGLSSSGDSLPYFNLQIGECGVIIAVGWTGGWKAAFAREMKAPVVAVTAGMGQTHLLLHPGEEIRTPRILLLNWTGGDWLAAQNLWRRLVLAHYAPRINDRPLVFVGSWGSELIDRKLALVDLLQRHQFPYDTYTIDAGWFGHSVGDTEAANNAGPSPWWKNRGDWSPSPVTYPHGLGPLGETLHQDHRGFSLWIESETADPGTEIVTQHPGWFLHAPKRPTLLLNLGDATARRGITDLVSKIVTDDQVTWYRQDFNIPPARYWSEADTPDRVGMTEIRHIEGLYAFWDELHALHPGLNIDNCASGGRRLDLEMISRSFSIWRSDFGNSNAIAEEMQTQGLSQWVPLNMSFESLFTTAPWNQQEPFGSSAQVYDIRSGYGAGFGVNPGPASADNGAWLDWLKKAVDEYREVEPYFYGDFYPLLPYTLEENAWTAWQWDRPDLKEGIVLVLRRPEGLYTAMELSLHALDPRAQYAVEIRRGLEKTDIRMMSGEDLAHLQISLPERPSSALILYRKSL